MTPSPGGAVGASGAAVGATWGCFGASSATVEPPGAPPGLLISLLMLVSLSFFPLLRPIYVAFTSHLRCIYLPFTSRINVTPSPGGAVGASGAAVRASGAAVGATWGCLGASSAIVEPPGTPPGYCEAIGGALWTLNLFSYAWLVVFFPPFTLYLRCINVAY